ncbi:MAG: hypothetical protein E7214_08015 [Clostridium sp.]|nr:hypothetical protein [Clostridium sp.]
MNSLLTVDEVTKLSLFSNFKLIAGKNGLKNNLSNIVILEYESISDNFEVFSSGDFVLTSLFFAKDDISLLNKAFKNLIKIKVAAIAIKTVFFKDIPKNIKDMASRANIPIYTFEGCYMEDLIICVNELLKSKQQYLAFEEKINSLINIEPSPYTVEKTALEINSSFSKSIITAYITPKNKSENIFIYFNRMLYKKYQLSSRPNYSYIKYKNGILIIYSFDYEKENCDYIENFKELLKKIDINPNDFFIGIGNVHNELCFLNSSIKESIYANYICIYKNKDIMLYNKIGIYRFLFPIFSDKSIYDLYSNVINEIINYDLKYKSNLLETLLIYIKNNGEISKTATELFQHPNTIRYRLSKTHTIIEKYNLEDNFYEQIFLIIKLYQFKVSVKEYINI